MALVGWVLAAPATFMVFLPVIALSASIFGMWNLYPGYKDFSLSEAAKAKDRWVSLSLTIMTTLCIAGFIGGFVATCKLSMEMHVWVDPLPVIVILGVLALVYYFLWADTDENDRGDKGEWWISKQAVGGLLQYCALAPTAYGLLLCARAFMKIDPCAECLIPTMKRLLLYKLYFDGFVTFLGIALAVAIIMIWAHITNANAKLNADAAKEHGQIVPFTGYAVEFEGERPRRIVTVQKPEPLVEIQPDYILMFGLVFSVLVVVLATPGFLALNAAALRLRETFVPSVNPDMWKAWLETNKAYLEATATNPTSFLTSGALSTLAPFATAVLAYALPKAKDK